MKKRRFLRHLSSILVPLALGASLAAAETPGGGFTGTYIATLPERAEILQLHRDGTAPGSIPVVEFDCAYLDGFLYKRVPLE